MEFTYWKAENAVSVDGSNDEPLSHEQATVIALQKIAEELQNVSGTLKDILYFMQHQEFQVHQTN